MLQCSNVGCTNPPSYEIERTGSPVNAPAAKMVEFRCSYCLEQDQRNGSAVQVTKSYVVSE
jgi:hypothetical protein